MIEPIMADHPKTHQTSPNTATNIRANIGQTESNTHILITHHFLGRYCGLDPPDRSLMNVHIEGQALEAAEYKYHRDGQYSCQDHDNCYCQHPCRVWSLHYATLSKTE